MAQPQMVPQPEKSSNSSWMIWVILGFVALFVVIFALAKCNGSKKEAYTDECLDSLAVEPWYDEYDAVPADIVPAEGEDWVTDSIICSNIIFNAYGHEMGYGETIHHHFEGSMTDHTGPHPITLDFDFANSSPYRFENVVYTNVTFGGKIRMTGYVSDDGRAYLSGKDGSSDFNMNFSMYDYTGSATVGSKSLTVELTPYACSH